MTTITPDTIHPTTVTDRSPWKAVVAFAAGAALATAAAMGISAADEDASPASPAPAAASTAAVAFQPSDDGRCLVEHGSC